VESRELGGCEGGGEVVPSRLLVHSPDAAKYLPSLSLSLSPLSSFLSFLPDRSLRVHSHLGQVRRLLRMREREKERERERERLRERHMVR
jgi:hypothetical protein